MAKSAELDRARQMFEDMKAAIAGPEVADLRAAYDGFTDRLTVPPDIQVEEVDAGGVPALLVSAPGASAERMVVFLHGGGYVLGRARGYRALAHAISQAADARVLVVDYRLAPEHAHPAAVQDGVAAVRWAISQTGSPSAVVVAGDSAGGGLTLATLLALKEEGDALPAGAVGLSPWVDLTNSGDSYERNRDADPVVSEEMVTNLSAAYLQGQDASLPLASPLFADLAGLPPLLVFVGTAEILEDDARRLAERVEAAGGEVELVVEDDLIHVYPVFSEFLPEAAEAVEHIGRFVRSVTASSVV
jgi:monoterpene epsilon-lactone hydrolase